MMIGYCRFEITNAGEERWWIGREVFIVIFLAASSFQYYEGDSVMILPGMPGKKKKFGEIRCR
jgi:hypothetical protein